MSQVRRRRHNEVPNDSWSESEDEIAEPKENTMKKGLRKIGELAHDIKEVAINAFVVLETVVSSVVPLFVEFAVPLLIFVGIGFTLVFLRRELIKSAPFVSKNARKFEVAANGFEVIFGVLLDTVKGIVFAIRYLISVVSPSSPRPDPPNWFWPKTNISAEEIIDLADAVTFCSNTTTDEALEIITQYTGNTAVCPVLRAATPLRWINTTILPAFNWLSFNYTPMAQDEETGLGNCRTPDDYRFAICAGLQSGHILLEIMIPVAIGALCFISLFRAIFTFVFSVLKLTWTVSIDTLHILKL